MSRLGLAFDAVVLGNDVQRQQVLPLVFVNALDQNVEQRVRVDVNTVFSLDMISQVLFNITLDLAELLSEAGIVDKAFELVQLIQIFSSNRRRFFE